MVIFPCSLFWVGSSSGVGNTVIKMNSSQVREINTATIAPDDRSIQINTGADSEGFEGSVKPPFDSKFHFHGNLWINLINLEYHLP